MTFDSSKPVQTRDGLPVEILKTDFKGTHSIIGVTTNSDGGQCVEQWNSLGEYHSNKNPCVLDLINTPETHEVVVYLYWVEHNNCYEVRIGKGNFSPTWKYLASVRVPFTEGEFEKEQGT